jgi:antitoxin ParD1/3/4
VAIYGKLLSADIPEVDRQAAFRMQLVLAGEGGRAMILNTLAGNDQALYQPAIAMIHMSFNANTIGQVLPSMDKLPENAQVQLVAVLAGYPATSVLPAVVKAAQGPALPSVRMEALRTIGKIGNASVVTFLARQAAAAVGDEQALARETLVRLKDFVEERVKTGGYSTPSEYVRELLREDQKRQAAQKLEALLLDGVLSGTPIEANAEYWETKRRQLLDRHNRERGK